MARAILLTGGTGFLGQNLAPELAAWAEARGYKTLALVRPPLERPSARRLLQLGFELITGDIRRLQGNGSARVIEGVDIVIHLVGLLEGSREELLKVNQGGTAGLLQAVRAAGGQRFIHLSSLGAAPNSKLPYAYSIWLGEQEVRQSGLPFVIFRPSVLIGPGDPFAAGLLRIVRDWPVLLLPKSRTRFQPLWVGDMARCILHSIEDDQLLGKLVKLGGPEVLTLEEMAKLLLAKLGATKPTISLPRRSLRFTIKLLRRCGVRTPYVGGHLIGTDRVAGPAAVEAACGFSPKPLGEVLQLHR